MSSFDNDRDDDEPGYLFDEADQALLQLIAEVLHRGFFEQRATWAQKVSIAKLLHVLTRLPARPDVMVVEVSFVSPRQTFDDIDVYFWLTVQVDGLDLSVTYGGHVFNPSRGGDIFTAFRWDCSPGGEPEWVTYYPQLAGVPGLQSPDEAFRGMGESQSGFAINVTDDENPLLDCEACSDGAFITLSPSSMVSEASQGDERQPRPGWAEVDEEASEDDSDDDTDAPAEINPVSRADKALLASIGPPSLSKINRGSAFGVENCDGCGLDLSTVGFFVDGNAPQSGWGNYCANCTLQKKVPIAYGRGQLYARQPNGDWYGVAGF